VVTELALPPRSHAATPEVRRRTLEKKHTKKISACLKKKRKTKVQFALGVQGRKCGEVGCGFSFWFFFLSFGYTRRSAHPRSKQLATHEPRVFKNERRALLPGGHNCVCLCLCVGVFLRERSQRKKGRRDNVKKGGSKQFFLSTAGAGSCFFFVVVV
jgi:hypothetical protein